MAATEIALSTCQFGCKVMRCTCGYVFLFHSATYGHQRSSVQQSSTGARCTCPTNT